MRRMHGISLIEMMVTLAIGMLILTGMLTVFVNSMKSERELVKAAEQVENGRYAIEELTNDLRLAGYYGQYPYFGVTTPAALPDPCVTDTSDLADPADPAYLLGSLALSVQSHAADNYAGGAFVAAPDLSTIPECAAILTSTILSPGSDVLVIRRADTQVVTTTPVLNEVYQQSNFNAAAIQIGVAYGTFDVTKKADGTAAAFPLLTKGSTTNGAEIRKFHVHVYYVDRSGASPTLKRLELKSVAGVATMSVVSIAEGIEAFTVDFGLDKLPVTVNDGTRLKGDSVVDEIKREPTTAEYADAVVAEVRILARNTNPTAGFADGKTYDMGRVGSFGPTNDQFKRHLFSATVRLVNPAARREIVGS